MANMTFGGAVQVPLWKLPYTLPAAAFVSQVRWQADSWGKLKPGVSGALATYYRMRLRNFKTYNDIDPAYDIGAPYQVSGMTYGPADPATYVPEFAPYPLAGNSSVGPFSFQNIVASSPPSFDGNGASAHPVAAQDQLAWWFSTLDTPSGNTYNALIFPGNLLTQGWFGPNIAVNAFGQSFYIDIPNNQTLALNQNGSHSILLQAVFDSAGNITSNTLITGLLTGLTWLDSPQYSNPWNGVPFGKSGVWWLLTADNTDVTSGPLVTNGSPLFVINPTFDTYYEIVFSSSDPLVQKNILSTYGPPWNFNSFGSPLVVLDPSGVLYYLQPDSYPTNYMNVYSSGNPNLSLNLNPLQPTIFPLPFCVGKTCCDLILLKG